MVDDQCDVDVEKDDHTSDDRGASSPLARRSYLKLTGTAAASLAAVGTLGRASAATTRHGISFNKVVNVVDDLGVDPSGGQIDDIIGKHAEGGTLLVFPEGEYQFKDTQSVNTGSDVVGFLGKGDVKFVPPQGLNDDILAVSAKQVLLENIDVDLTADNTVTGFTVHSQDAFHVQDIEFHGRGLHEDHRTTNYISVSVSNPDATGVLKNFVVKKGDAWSHYRGATGIWVGARHKGTVKIVDCQIQECGGDGIYASRNNGKVHIEGGVFRNNNVCCVRISGEGSYVDGAVMEVDPEKYTGPHTQEGSSFNLRCVVIEQKTSSQSLTKPAGAEIRNCDITVKKNPTSGAGIAVWSNGKTATVKNTRIRIDNDSPAILREGRRKQGKNPPAGSPRWIRMDNCAITGSGSSEAAIVADAANDSEIKNCYIKQTGANRNGIKFVNSSSTVVRDTIIDVIGKAVNYNSASGKTLNIAHSGPMPSGDIGAPSGGHIRNKSSGKDRGGSSQHSGNDSSKGTTAKPKKKKSGNDSSKGMTAKPKKKKSDSGSAPAKDRNRTKSAKPENTTDSNNSGKHTETTVRIDGEKVDPSELGSGGEDDHCENNGSLPHTFVVKGGGPKLLNKYAFTVSGSLEKGEYADSSEKISGSSAHGAVNGKRDSYRFSGRITQCDIDGNADITFE